jgi:effector-binding domain-containing protein
MYNATMKKLRQFILLLLCIILFLISIGFLLPKSIRVDREINIHSNKPFIFNKLNTIKNWGNYLLPMFSGQTQIENYFGPEFGPGAKLVWVSKSEEIKTGSLTIMQSNPYDSILYLIDYIEKGKSSLKIVLNNDIQSTKVKIVFETNLGINPISRWIGLFSDRMIGSDMQRSLKKMQIDLEKPITYNGFSVEELEIPAQYILSIRDTATNTTISKKLIRMYRRIALFVNAKKMTPAGEPFTVYHSYSQNGFDIETCLPIISSIQSSSDVIFSELSSQKTVMVKYSGNNKNINLAYQALTNYINDNGLQIAGPPWEKYIRNSIAESDTGNWQTNIYFPVK